MEGLFFVVDPVWWIGSFYLSSLITGLIIGAIIGLYLLYRGHRGSHAPIRQREPYRFHQVSLIDPNYIEKMLIEIRKYLTYHYPPAHSWAHIPRDIEAYSTDTRLITIIKQLEQTAYSGKSLTREELENIQSELMATLKK